MHFEILGKIDEIVSIAVGGRIRDIMRLRRQFGPGRKKSTPFKYVLCVKNNECADLEKQKVYRVIPDEEAEREGYLRVLDETGEDYLYPDCYFVRIQLPHAAEAAIRATG